MKSMMIAMPAQDIQEQKDEAHRQGKYDLQTLMEAESIKKDPKKMKHVMKHAKNHAASIQSIQDLKDAYEAKYGEGRLLNKKVDAAQKKEESDETVKV